MEKDVKSQKILHFQNLFRDATDEAQRKQIETLIAEYKAKSKPPGRQAKTAMFSVVGGSGTSLDGPDREFTWWWIGA